MIPAIAEGQSGCSGGLAAQGGPAHGGALRQRPGAPRGKPTGENGWNAVENPWKPMKTYGKPMEITKKERMETETRFRLVFLLEMEMVEFSKTMGDRMSLGWKIENFVVFYCKHSWGFYFKDSWVDHPLNDAFMKSRMV